MSEKTKKGLKNFFNDQDETQKTCVIIGSGYVGLVSAVCFAEKGFQVVCVDVNKSKIEELRQGKSPIYEPGLDDLLIRNLKANRIRFADDLAVVMNQPAIVFIAVGTPGDDTGASDLTYVFSVANQIGSLLKHPSIIVNKSTVPVGTGDRVKAIIEEGLNKRKADIAFSVVSNPEFLKEGKAIEDFMSPDRVIIGAEDAMAADAVAALYEPFVSQDKILRMSLRDAEMTKYAANAMLASRISFINEMALLCEKLGADIEAVRLGIGSDTRIGIPFLLAGCGYGGSCFPKDVSALVHMAKSVGIDPVVLQAIQNRNQTQKQCLFEKIKNRLGDDLSGQVIAVLGLAFKPETDDMREATSLVLIESLLKAKATVRAYDPVAMSKAASLLSSMVGAASHLELVDSALIALDQADALVIVTEWDEFKQLDLAMVKRVMQGNLLIDGRNIYPPEVAKKIGFDYQGVGRGGHNAS